MLSRLCALCVCCLALLGGSPERSGSMLERSGISIAAGMRPVAERTVGAMEAATTVEGRQDDTARATGSANETDGASRSDAPSDDQTPWSSNLVGLVLAGLGGLFGLGGMFVTLRAAARWEWTGWLYSIVWLCVPTGIGMTAFLFGTALALEYFGEAFTVAFLFFGLPLTVLGYPIYGLLLVYNPTFQSAREEANERPSIGTCRPWGSPSRRISGTYSTR